jgi:2-methylcitrate dehydratase PrpD
MEKINTELTLMLSKKLVELEYEKLPPEVIKKAKQLLLDFIGYTLHAYKEEEAEIIISTIKELGGKKESTVLGYGFKTSCLLSAFANGAMGHMTELDDIHAGTSSHPGDSIISAALALGERERVNGKELLTAIIVGYEAALRIGESVMPTHYWRGFHPSATFNTFGSAVTAAKILKFNPEQTAGALGLAGLQASGYFYFTLENCRMPKDFNTGRAALSGIFAALLVQKGFQGGKTVLESEKGFCKLFSDPFSIRYNRINDRIGQLFKIMEVAHKPYVGCSHLLSAIDATLNIIRKHPVNADEVEEVNARIFETGASFVDNPEPWLSDKADQSSGFSTQFNLAVAILEGKKGIQSLLNRDNIKKKINDPTLRKFMKKVKVIPDSDLDKEYPKAWATVVEIKTKKDFFSERVNLPKGGPSNPLTQKELEEKFIVLTENVIKRDVIKKALKMINSVEELEDVRSLLQLFIR